MAHRAVIPGLLTAALVATTGLLSACLVQEHCFSNEDCPGQQQCDALTGTCSSECDTDEDCAGTGFSCVDHTCIFDCDDSLQLTCPQGMVSICGRWCMDVYEASRPDATSTSVGSDASMATSRAGVMPWYSSDAISGMNPTIAQAACQAAGKRLCTPEEWEVVCAGLDRTAYSYGNDYDAETCNGIDTFCECEDADPYPHCHLDCPYGLHPTPTGDFPDCTNSFGIYDINGNVWEVVSTSDGLHHYRGGAFNCGDSEALHRCTYDATWNPSAKGFRCCADGEAR